MNKKDNHSKGDENQVYALGHMMEKIAIALIYLIF
jgi:hypothetical protein